jgi:hypothetical protein
MIRLDPKSAQCLVFTRKEGLLSLVAHDLKIAVTGFAIEVDPAARTVAGRFDADSLRVVCAMNGDEETAGTLSPSQKAEIEGNIVRDVLHTRQYPEIRYTSRHVHDVVDGFDVDGDLSLHGKNRSLPVTVRRTDSGYVARAVIHQPDFGIRPYSALLGTLKVQADVEIRILVPWPQA